MLWYPQQGPPRLARSRWTRRARCAARQRAEPYEDTRHLVDHWPDWVTRAEPLGVGPVAPVDTAIEVQIDSVVQRLNLDTRAR
jgi:hypothetical protein